MNGNKEQIPISLQSNQKTSLSQSCQKASFSSTTPSYSIFTNKSLEAYNHDWLPRDNVPLFKPSKNYLLNQHCNIRFYLHSWVSAYSWNNPDLGANTWCPIKIMTHGKHAICRGINLYRSDSFIQLLLIQLNIHTLKMF